MSRDSREAAKLAVRQWAAELEAMQAGNSKHPLHRVRELHLGAAAATVSGTGKVTARAVASRSSPGSMAPVVRMPGAAASETHWIMREVHNIDPDCYRVLLAWGLGFSIADQARAANRSKSKLEKVFEGGLYLVRAGRLWGVGRLR